ncbi:hypothetical protein [Planktothrix sp.]|uniref:hypothetical protein n=1 Tax=Planktothrix sp. TaxID=3088171 RepID=UPI0038D35926
MDDLDFVDYRQEAEECGISWRDIVDGVTLYDKMESLLNQVVILPEQEKQIPIFLSFLLTPSAMSYNLPICVLYGSSGSGKSETSKLASALHNTPMQTAASTFASIRNLISTSRYYDSDKEFERNFLLVWDDINEKVFTDSEQMFSLFKSGTNYKSVITIADKMGVNMEFKPFAPKLCSTVQPFWDNPKLTELKRRLLPILFAKLPDYSSIEFDLVSVDEINFNGLNNEFEMFWRDKKNRDEFNARKRSLSRLKSSVIPIETLRLYQDNIACSCVVLDITTKESLKIWEDYYQFVNEKIFDVNIGIQRVFNEWIESEECHFIDLIKLRQEDDGVIQLKPLIAFNHLESCYANGEISQKPDRGMIESFFVTKGYQKVKTRIGYLWSKTLFNSDK